MSDLMIIAQTSLHTFISNGDIIYQLKSEYYIQEHS